MENNKELKACRDEFEKIYPHAIHCRKKLAGIDGYEGDLNLLWIGFKHGYNLRHNEAPTGEIGELKCPACDELRAREGYEDNLVEQLAFELAVELEQAELNSNDYVTVNRAKLKAIAQRVYNKLAIDNQAQLQQAQKMREALDKVIVAAHALERDKFPGLDFDSEQDFSGMDIQAASGGQQKLILMRYIQRIAKQALNNKG